MKKKIFIDTDIGSDCDDAGALAVLHTLCSMGLCDIIGVTYCLSCESGPSAIDAINLYFKRPGIPIGTLKLKGYHPNSQSPFTDVIKKEFFNRYHDASDCEDSVKMYRRIFSSQQDRSITMVTIGPLTNLKLFFESGPDEYSPLSGKELFAKKVDRICVMGGSFVKDGQAEFNLKSDLDAANMFFADCEAEIYIVPFEIGAGIIVGDELMKTGDRSNPIYRCYEVYCGGARGSWDLCTVLFAVLPQLPCWELSEAGKVTIDSTGVTSFEKNIGGNVYRVFSEDDDCIKNDLEKLILGLHIDT